MTEKKTTRSAGTASKSKSARRGTDPDKIAEAAAPLPSPLNEIPEVDETDLAVRDQTGEPTEQLGGDRKMDRGRLTVPPAPAQPEIIHNRTRRNDHDALHGHAVEIVDDIEDEVLGKLKGKHGIFERTESYEKDGYPKQVIVTLHGVAGRILSVPYKAIRHLPQVHPGRWTRTDG